MGLHVQGDEMLNFAPSIGDKKGEKKKRKKKKEKRKQVIVF